MKRGIFHHFHLTWISAISKELNAGLLPPDYYALAEQIVSNLGPDVLTLRRPANGAVPVVARAAELPWRWAAQSAISLASKVRRTGQKTVVIRHTSNHQVIALIEIVYARQQEQPEPLDAFVKKADAALVRDPLADRGLFPPGPHDPQGIHRKYGARETESIALPPDKPLTLAAYIGSSFPEAFVGGAVGTRCPEMPILLTPEIYVRLPLGNDHQMAWEAVPAYWREVLEKPNGT